MNNQTQTVKFAHLDDMRLFCLEEGLSIPSDVHSIEIDEGVALKRNHRRKKTKDLKKSVQTKKQWKTKGRSMKRAIGKFHRSSKGKAFHRKLGRLLATRDFRDKHNEWLVSVNSLLTHLAIEEQFSSSLDVEAEVSLLKEESFSTLSPLISKLVLEEEINIDDILEELTLLNILVNYPDFGESK